MTYLSRIPAAIVIYSTAVFDDSGMSPCFDFILPETAGTADDQTTAWRAGQDSAEGCIYQNSVAHSDG